MLTIMQLLIIDPFDESHRSTRFVSHLDPGKQFPSVQNEYLQFLVLMSRVSNENV
jgi:hypothetical protein